MSAPSSALHLATPGTDVRAIALVLHGGRETSSGPVRARQLAVLRMLPFARSLAEAGSRQGLAVARLRYAVRGWNGDLRSPVADTRAALSQLTALHPGVPVALIGHSMGGRTALHVAEDPAVTVVAALAPWIVPGDPVATMAGCRLLVIHGDRDRMTDPRASRQYVDVAGAVAASASWIGVRGDGHAMLRRARLWHELVTGFVLGAMFDTPVVGTVREDSANLVEMALAGQARVIV